MPTKLRAVLVCAKSDSAQCWLARSLTLRSVSRRGVNYFASENESFSKTILACLSGVQVGSIHEEEKNVNKSHETVTSMTFLG